MSAAYEYGARGDLPPVRLTWHQGENKPEIWKNGGIPKWDSGCLFVGSKGMLLADYGKHVLLPEKKFEGFQRPPPTIPRSPGHHVEWLQACKTGKPASANFEYSGWLTEANHLGNVAYRTGRKLHWNSKSMKATNAPEADQFIRRTYRKGWALQGCRPELFGNVKALWMLWKGQLERISDGDTAHKAGWRPAVILRSEP